jgi:hypothetical protein
VPFTGYTGNIVNTFEANGLAPGSTRAAASSKYPRSKSRKLTSPDLVGNLADADELPGKHDAEVDLTFADANTTALRDAHRAVMERIRGRIRNAVNAS